MPSSAIRINQIISIILKEAITKLLQWWHKYESQKVILKEFEIKIMA